MDGGPASALPAHSARMVSSNVGLPVGQAAGRAVHALPVPRACPGPDAPRSRDGARRVPLAIRALLLPTALPTRRVPEREKPAKPLARRALTE